MYNSLAGAPTSVNEQLTKQETRCSACTWSFGLSEVDEAEATELPELVPVSFLRIQTITITLDA